MVSIAIDGPSGAGKSTMAKRLAAALGYLYVDTGALYRAIGLAALRAGVNPKDEAAVAALLPQLDVGLQHGQDGQRVLLAAQDVSEAIRAEEVGMAASDVSAHAPVRDFLLETQRRLAREHNVVMDGRDIGTVVLPAADIKIFLTADAEDRAQRRFLELQKKGERPVYETVLADVKTRDHNDSTRAVAPLRQAEDAHLVDTTHLPLQESWEKLYTLVQHLQKGGAPA